MRRGLLKELDEVFDAAHDMIGGTCNPDEKDNERDRLKALRKEVFGLLALLDRYISWRQST